MDRRSGQNHRCRKARAPSVGFDPLAVAAQLLVFPLFGLATTLRQNLAIGAIFTTVSLARSYLLRRAFEAFRG